MDMSLDERIAASNPGRHNGSRRGGIRKGAPPNGRRGPNLRRNKDSGFGSDTGFDVRREWAHDKWEGSDDDMGDEYNTRGSYDTREDRERNRGNNNRGGGAKGYKVLITNLHEAIGTEDLKAVFSEPGGLRDARIHWQRDRSTGRAFVVYDTYEQARRAVSSFDGQLAKGQSLRVRHDHEYNQPKRSLESRITHARRSASPGDRRSNTTRTPPPHIDRYIPGDRDRGNNRDRRPRNQPREPKPRGGQPRPRKTKEELDAEMEDYFGKPEGEAAPAIPANNDGMEVDEML